MGKRWFIYLIAVCLTASSFLPAAPQGETTEAQTKQASSDAEPEIPVFVTTLPQYDDDANEKGDVADKKGLWREFKERIEGNLVREGRWRYLVQGFIVTLEVSFFSALLGLAIGFVVAVVRSISDQTGAFPVLNWVFKVYLTVIRGTPVVVQLLFIYFVVLGTVDVSKTLAAIMAFGINSGAYVAEIIRGGINSIDGGQMEAGRSLGLSYLQSMRLIILPQAIKGVLPSLGNEFIALLKETSVAGYIALADLTKGGDIIRSQTYDAFVPLLLVALIYLVVVVLFTYLLSILEKRLRKNER